MQTRPQLVEQLRNAQRTGKPNGLNRINMKIRKTDVYIAVRKKGYHDMSARLTKTSPALDHDEIAIKVSLEVPEELLTKPQLHAKVTVPEEAVSKPIIEADVIDNVESIIAEQTGFNVRLEAVTEED
jgi:hypothetical protein